MSTTADAPAATAQRSVVPTLIAAMRPYQWPKNVIVFAALIFTTGDAWQPRDLDSLWPLLWRTCALFGLWSLAASATYLLNDVRDRENDRLHPRKARRPIASGEVSVGLALAVAAVLTAVALPLTFLLDTTAALILAGYSALMVAYSFGLKTVAILDIIILTGGVVARAAAGATAIDVDISPWLYVCSSFAALFFATSKRWAEYRQLGPEAARHRPALEGYSGDVLGQMLTITAGGALLSYALYTIESARVPTNGSMALTLPFVAFGLFRYLLLLNGERKPDAPDRILFTDPQLLLAVAGFVITALAVLASN
ncbi:MAG: UbiA family prenyltransferase [Dehalococcoidia bacterium]|nr:UbiA family prenyltransferase [Dehalococcoidia bacterium]